MQEMGGFDATIADAGYGNTKIKQEQARQKTGPKQYEKEHVRAEKAEAGSGPSKAGNKTIRESA